MRQISLASSRALERYSTRFTFTTAVSSSMAASNASTGTVRPSGDSRYTTSAPRTWLASQMWQSVGKSSSVTMTLRRFEKSTHDARLARASDTLTVMASSSTDAPISLPNVSFSARILGKMSSSQTWSGAPFVAQASTYSCR